MLEPNLSKLVVQRVHGDALDDAYRVRREVFVREQGVPAQIERDEADAEAIHVVAYLGDDPVGTGRVVLRGDGAKIGRMAVLAPYRGRGVGARILASLIDEARLAGAEEVCLHAQLPAENFYARHGFASVGDVFQEAGIDHIVMKLRLDP